MQRRHVLALTAGILGATLAGCVSESDSRDDTAENGSDSDRNYAGGPGQNNDDSDGRVIDLDDEMASLVGASNEFAFDLYGELLEANPEANLFSSPISIAIALAMTYAGAREQTREQMRAVLHFELDDEVIHETFGKLQTELDGRGDTVGDETEDETQDEESDEENDEGSDEENDEGSDESSDTDETAFELSIANAVWGQEAYPFEQSYLDLLEDHYGGGLREVDFTSDYEAAREEINTWVADQTEDRIEDLLPSGSLDSLTRLVLTNAIYFLATWKHPFPEGATQEETFTALDGSQHEVDMMRQDRSFQYAEVDGLQAVDLPYVGEEVSMLVMLPLDGEFETIEAAFDRETLATVTDALDSREGTVHLPRFEFDSGFALRGPLQRLGMEDAFETREADFSGIADVEEALFVDDVYHDTFVAVDEEGTEAAAATAVVFGTESAPVDPFEFVADRPFLFAIRDRPTGSILFFGRVVDPTGWAE